MFRLAIALGVVSVMLGGTARTAHAGRSFYGWLIGPEVMPERGVELQTWTWEENRVGPDHEKTTAFLWAPYIGITDRLELGLPVEARWVDSDVRASPSFTIYQYGVEARYRFVSPDPVDKPDFVPLARIAVKRDVISRDALRLETDLVGAYDAGRVQVLADIGFVAEFSKNSGNTQEIHPGVGVSVEVIPDLRFGAEAYAQIEMQSGGDRWYVAGPDIAWTHGRFWLSGVYAVGISGIKDAPRVQWGILF